MNKIKNKNNTSYKNSKSRKSHERRFTLLMEHNLVDILTGPTVLTQQDRMIIKRVKYVNSPLVITTQKYKVSRNPIKNMFLPFLC